MNPPLMPDPDERGHIWHRETVLEQLHARMQSGEAFTQEVSPVLDADVTKLCQAVGYERSGNDFRKR